jgi:hypothetical protein
MTTQRSTRAPRWIPPPSTAVGPQGFSATPAPPGGDGSSSSSAFCQTCTLDEIVVPGTTTRETLLHAMTRAPGRLRTLARIWHAEGH